MGPRTDEKLFNRTEWRRRPDEERATETVEKLTSESKTLTNRERAALVQFLIRSLDQGQDEEADGARDVGSNRRVADIKSRKAVGRLTKTFIVELRECVTAKRRGRGREKGNTMERVDLPLSKLTRAQKLHLMEAIWEDLSKDEESLESPSWHEQVLDDREQALAAGKATIADWDDAKERIRRKTTCE